MVHVLSAGIGLAPGLKTPWVSSAFVRRLATTSVPRGAPSRGRSLLTSLSELRTATFWVLGR